MLSWPSQTTSSMSAPQTVGCGNRRRNRGLIGDSDVIVFGCCCIILLQNEVHVVPPLLLVIQIKFRGLKRWVHSRGTAFDKVVVDDDGLSSTFILWSSSSSSCSSSPLCQKRKKAPPILKLRVRKERLLRVRSSKDNCSLLEASSAAVVAGPLAKAV